MNLKLALLFFLSQLYPQALPAASENRLEPLRQRTRRRHKQNKRAKKGASTK